MKKRQLISYTIMSIALYLIATGVSYGAFTYLGKSAGTTEKTPTQLSGASGKPTKTFKIDQSLPRTEVCPLNGEKFAKAQKDLWDKRRPMAVMIENTEEARPQSGLSYADIVYESAVEYGITRFMGVFYCNLAGENNVALAPVRSARTYFLPWVLEYDALYNHVGGAGNCDDPTVDDRAKALCQIDQYGVKDMDQFGLPFKYALPDGSKIQVCYRNPDRLDHEVATEHTMVCATEGLYKFAELENDWTNVDKKGIAWDKKFTPWKFKEEAKVADRADQATPISFVAWKQMEATFGVKWTYDKVNNVYLRENGGKIHIDLETNEQLKAKVVIVEFAKETTNVDEHGHLLYGNIGAGTGIVFQDGKATKVNWQKADKNARTKYIDASTGKEIELNAGKIWIAMLPIGTNVTY